MVKFTVEKVRVVDVAVLLLIDEVTAMTHTFQTFIVWLKHLIQSIPEIPTRK